MELAITLADDNTALVARIDKIVRIATLLDDVDNVVLDALLDAITSGSKHPDGPASRSAWLSYHVDHHFLLPALAAATQLCQPAQDAVCLDSEAVQ